MQIRKAFLSDLDSLSAVENQCFPASEAASRKNIRERLEYYPNHFWVMTDNGILVSFIDGLATDLPDLLDEMYERADMHNEQGEWQMILGVNTILEYRKMGCAGKLIRQAIDDCKAQDRRGLVLTCKEKLMGYYSKFGFVNEGVSKSTHGNVKWYQMRLKLDK
ncbi:hypothetical protein IMSAG049_00271 [Clostridiales bacterium]|nr:hypothetical protein IMSAG049_00271 [Clostridiales bacterium]